MIEWRNNGIKYDFWKWVLDHARKGVRENWPFQDRKCPHCNTWQSEIGGFSVSRDSTNTGLETMVCGQCKKPSRWRDEGIVAFTATTGDGNGR